MIKIKRIQWKDFSETRYIKGYVFRKNVANRKMKCNFEKPSILVISPSLDIQNSKDEGVLTTFDSL